MSVVEPAGPVEPSQRIKTIDIVRGFALLGVLMVNMTIFKSTQFFVPPTPTQFSDPASRAGAWIIQTLFTARFYAIFSFLFGLGFFLIMRRAEARGQDVAALYGRRLKGLLLIGLVHLGLIWSGDILTMYAITGFILLKFRNTEGRELTRWIVGLWLLSICIFGLVSLAQLPQLAHPEITGWLEMLVDRALTTYRGGSVGEIMAFRWAVEIPNALSGLLMIPNLLAFFLAGVYVGRLRLFEAPEEHLGLLRRWQLIGLLVGGAFLALFLLVETRAVIPGNLERMLALQMLIFLGAPFQSAFYVSTLTLFLGTSRGRWVLGPLAAVGRMALTNYLAQSLICILVFYNYGLGLFGQVSVVGGIWLTILIFGVQVVASNLWMSRYKYGPMELLWRRWTYGTLPASRPAAPGSSGHGS